MKETHRAAGRRTCTAGILLEETESDERLADDDMEHTDRSLSLCNLGKLHDTAALGSRALVQDLGELDLPRRLEQLNKVLVCR